MNSRQTIQEIIAKKKKGERIVMLTAYDYPLAKIIDQCGIDIILVGDSLANVVLGLKSTREVGMEVMLHHTKAVNRGVEHALLVGDMPYEAYQIKPEFAVKNAKRFVEEAGCNAVKLEWFDRCLDVAQDIIRAGIPVMGHVGLTPQNAERLGGMKLQGKDASSAQKIIDNAQALEKVGCFSIVLECIPDKIAEIITRKLKIPTIGIGAGPACDGQVLVTHDLLGLFDWYQPKFAKQYVKLNEIIGKAVTQFREEVRHKDFPSAQYTFTIKPQEFKKFKINK